MTLKILGSFFLLVATPVVGLTLSGKRVDRSKASPARHINWDPQCPTGEWCGIRENGEIAGLANMAAILKYLVALGKHYNASVHIKGGVNGAHLHLEPRHSPHVNQSWGHYFDVSSNEGNPFNDLHVDEKGCTEIWDVNQDFHKLFEHGESCLTFRQRYDKYTNKRQKELFKEYRPVIPASREVVEAVQVVQKKIPQNYGVLHVRRCDRLNVNGNCTAISNIAEKIKEQKKTVDAWVVFSYAEKGYDEELAAKLKEMNQKAIFEKDIAAEMNPNNDEDNYFAYHVTDHLMGGASVLIDMHNCKGGLSPALVQLDRSIASTSQTSMLMELFRSKVVCTWKPGDKTQPMPKQF